MLIREMDSVVHRDKAVLEDTAEEGCDMIIIGSRGLGQLAGLLLGSVSSAVAQRA